MEKALLERLNSGKRSPMVKANTGQNNSRTELEAPLPSSSAFISRGSKIRSISPITA
jgi:hypothetical protein